MWNRCMLLSHYRHLLCFPSILEVKISGKFRHRYNFFEYCLPLFSHWEQHVVIYNMRIHVYTMYEIQHTHTFSSLWPVRRYINSQSSPLCLWRTSADIWDAFGLCLVLCDECVSVHVESGTIKQNIFLSFFLPFIFPSLPPVFLRLSLREVKSQCGGRLRRRSPTGSLRRLQMSGVMGSSPGRWCHTERGLTGIWATKMWVTACSCVCVCVSCSLVFSLMSVTV